MPRIPYYNGGIASRSTAYGFAPSRPDVAGLARDVMSDSGSILPGIFIGKQNAAERELARQRAAAAAVDEQRVREAQAAAEARAGASQAMDELAYRSGRGAPTGPNMGVSPVEVADPVAYAAPASDYPTQQEQSAALRNAATDAARHAIGGGASPKDVSPILQSFLLTNGDDEGIVRANSALEGKYLGKDQNPSLARQDFQREDEQRHDLEKQAGDLRMKKYGFDLEHGDRVLNIETDAGVQRRGQDIAAGTARRGQDIGSADQRRGQDMTDRRARDSATQGTETVTTTTKDPGQEAKSKFLGIFGEERPGRAPSTTKRTVKRPLGGGSSRPPLSAFGQ